MGHERGGRAEVSTGTGEEGIGGVWGCRACVLVCQEGGACSLLVCQSSAEGMEIVQCKHFNIIKLVKQQPNDRRVSETLAGIPMFQFYRFRYRWRAEKCIYDNIFY